MALKTKSSAVLFPEFTVSLCHILSKLEEIHRLNKCPQPENLIITSANDSKHKIESKHYKNQALDLRSKNFKTETEKADFMQELSKALGPKFTIIYEYPGLVNEHFHIQVKKGEVFP
jgi:hypothetical protein